MKFQILFIFVLLSLSFLSCRHPDDMKKIEELENLRATLQTELATCEAKKPKEVFKACEKVQAELKNLNAPKTFEITKELKKIPCDEKVSLKVSKYDSRKNRLYLSYTIEAKTFFTDVLPLDEKRKDLASLLLHDSFKKVVLSVNSCTKESCKITCHALVLPSISCEKP